MNVTYGKLKKPLEYNCKRYCDLYPCKRTECNMRKGTTTPIKMQSKAHCDKWDMNMKVRLYREKGELLWNTGTFRRRSVR